MKKSLVFLGTFAYIASLSLSLVGCNKNKTTESKDLFKYTPTANQSEWIITGIEKEDGDGILDIPETVEGKPVTEIRSLSYCPSSKETSLHFTNVKTLSIPHSVKTLSPYLCKDMIGLEKVVFSENSQLEVLNESLFMGCENLNEILLPNSLKEIYASVFEGCVSLKDLYIPKNVNNVGASSFKDSGITTLMVDEKNEYFTTVDNVLFNKDKNTLYYYPSKKIENTYTVLESVNEIFASAFYNCQALKTVDLNNVTMVRKEAFAGCENLTAITANSLRYAEENVFNDTLWWKNYQVGEISLGKVLLSYTKFAFTLDLSGYVSIAPFAFKGHKDLRRITFDNELTTISDGAFMDCINLYEVIFHSLSRMVFIGQNVFENNASNRSFKVYKALYNDYIENDFWNVYKESIQSYP